MNDFKPREYQHLIIEAICTIPRVNVFSSMGTGKTVSTLTAIERMYLPGPVLILAPLRVAVNTWPDEVAKWSHLSDLTVSVITGKPAERLAALKAEAMIYTCNYENLPWLVEQCAKHYAHQNGWPFAMVICDESTRLKAFRLRAGSKRAAALAKVAHSKTKRFVNLTGTPAPNGLIDLWGQTWFVDKGQRLGRTFSAFTSRWFQQIRKGTFFELRPHDHAQKEIQQAISGITISIDARDYFSVKEPNIVPVKVKMPARAAKLYKQMEKEMFFELQGMEVEAMNAAAKTMKCLQIASGAVYGEDGKTWQEIHDEKIRALESIVEESTGTPILVAYHWKHDLERLRAAFPQAKTLSADPQVQRDWNAGKIPILLVHPASAGHGLNLQDGGNILVFFSVWWDLEQHQQVIERIGPVRQAQAGYDRPVWIYYILTQCTMDESCMQRLSTKATVQEILLQAMKRAKAANDDIYEVEEVA